MRPNSRVELTRRRYFRPGSRAA